jgi:hypothetical protein
MARSLIAADYRNRAAPDGQKPTRYRINGGLAGLAEPIEICGQAAI